MPVILHPHDEEQWVDASRTRPAKARSPLKPYPEELMEAHVVSPIVNSAKYDGPECIQPVSEETYRGLGSCPWVRTTVMTTGIEMIMSFGNPGGGSTGSHDYMVGRSVTNGDIDHYYGKQQKLIHKKPFLRTFLTSCLRLESIPGLVLDFRL